MILGKTRTFQIFLLIFVLKFSVVCPAEIKQNNDTDLIKSTFEEIDSKFDEEKYFDNNLKSRLEKDDFIKTKDPIVVIKALDKISSKTTTLKIKIGEEINFQNLKLKPLKCKNSEFDDNPNTIAYLQVIDINQKDNDKVFVFNGWTFASSPSLRPFDHPIYDIWLISCHNV